MGTINSSSRKKEPRQVYQRPQQLISSTHTGLFDTDGRSWIDRSSAFGRPQAFHPSSTLNRPLQVLNRYSYIGVGSIASTSHTEWATNYAPVPAIQPAPLHPRKSFEVPPSVTTWTQLYRDCSIPPDQFDQFNTRLKTNTDKLIKENEIAAETKRLERIRLESDIIIGKENQPPAEQSPKPSLFSLVNLQKRFESCKSLDNKYFPTEKKLPELTPQMLAEINAASRPQPLNEVLVELDGVQILRKDIQTLLNLNWLNDEIVNAYMNLIVLRGSRPNYKRVYAFNTFFYPKLRDSGYNSIKRWTRKVDIFCYDYILVPVHLGNHWCLAFIDFTDKTISYYDSLGGQPNGCCNILLDYLRQECSDKKKQDFGTENWQLPNKYNDGIPQQMNCSDCGVFACTYAEFLTRGAKLKFKQENMPYFRKKMIYEIIKKRILD